MKNLVKFKFLLAGFALICLASACTKLARTESDSEIAKSEDKFVVGDASKLLASAYTKLDVYTDQANIYALGEHTSAEMIPPTRVWIGVIMVFGVHWMRTLGMLRTHGF